MTYVHGRQNQYDRSGFGRTTLHRHKLLQARTKTTKQHSLFTMLFLPVNCRITTALLVGGGVSLGKEKGWLPHNCCCQGLDSSLSISGNSPYWWRLCTGTCAYRKLLWIHLLGERRHSWMDFLACCIYIHCNVHSAGTFYLLTAMEPTYCICILMVWTLKTVAESLAHFNEH